MRVTIKRKVYDTEKAKEVGKQVVSYFGDTYGFEEIMFEKAKNDFFLLVKGGPDSQYPEEQIIPLSLDDASEWLTRICGEAYKNTLVHEDAPKESAPKKTRTIKTTAKKDETTQASAAKKSASKKSSSKTKTKKSAASKA